MDRLARRRFYLTNIARAFMCVHLLSVQTNKKSRSKQEVGKVERYENYTVFTSYSAMVASISAWFISGESSSLGLSDFLSPVALSFPSFSSSSFFALASCFFSFHSFTFCLTNGTKASLTFPTTCLVMRRAASC